MTLEQPLVANPVERLPSRAPVQPRVPEPSNEPIEPLETAIVRRSPVVLVVAPEFGIERRGLMLDRVVPMVLAPLRHLCSANNCDEFHGPASCGGFQPVLMMKPAQHWLRDDSEADWQAMTVYKLRGLRTLRIWDDRSQARMRASVVV